MMGRWRTLLVITLAGVMLSAGTGAGAAPTADDDDTAGKINGSVSDELAREGRTSFWVVLKGEADLSGAKKLKAKADKAQFVLTAKTRYATKSQAGLRGLLARNNARYESFWITNAVLVTDGDAALLDKVAARPEVKSIEADTPVKLPEPKKGTLEEQVNGVEWGVDRIGAPRVWEEFGVRGEDVVVANIDTGVQFDHPALVGQYRGNNGNGTFTHDYNWFDPAGVCPGSEPCDNHGHGTHTMGTMVGDDGADNQVGVAPGAKWIAAKGCETGSCSVASLLASGQWVIAPTDLNGENPRPDLAPDVVSNSWGGGGGDFFYQDVVNSWVAAGIFPSFANGNSGPGCGSARSPGDYQASYGSGAFDIDNQIASFSSRGPGPNGEIKPNIAAPGVNVRSTWTADGYVTISGTSMATPHTSATVALMWSAAPEIRGDVTATREILDQSAVDTPDDQCGGTAEDNNVWGEGRLDAYEAVRQSPRGDLGAASGYVTAGGSPLAGATVTVDGPLNRVRITADDGSYSFRTLMVGDYTVTVEKFGYERATGSVTLVQGQTTTADFALQALPVGTLHGRVTDGSGHGWPLYAKITVGGYPGGPIYTDPPGGFSVRLPHGNYELRVDAVFDGYEAASLRVEVDEADVRQDIELTVDGSACVAMGYGWNGLSAEFHDWPATSPQDGWTVTATGKRGNRWRFDNPGSRAVPGDDDAFAIADANHLQGRIDSALITPVLDMSEHESPQVRFDTSYVGARRSQAADVDLSLDGGRTWTTVWHRSTESMTGRVLVPLSQAAGKDSVRVRFRYTGDRSGWWWAVDDVFIGTRTCVPVAGGLVMGTVTDTAGGPVNDASVISTERPRERGVSLEEGFYGLFSSLTGDREFTATKPGYETATAAITVGADQVTRHDWALRAPP